MEEKPTIIHLFTLPRKLNCNEVKQKTATTTELLVVVKDNRIITCKSMAGSLQ